MPTLSQRLRDLRAKYDYTQNDLAEKIGVNKQTISQYERGVRKPDNDTLLSLSRVLGVTTDYLLGKDEEAQKGVVKIPILGSIPAGIPTEMIEDIVDYEEIPDDMARTGDYFGLRIKGHSMEPKISDGDYIIIRKQDTADSGDIVVARINGNDGTCKRLKIWKDQLSLLSDNPACESYHFSAKEVAELPVRILGKVVELRAKF